MLAISTAIKLRKLTQPPWPICNNAPTTIMPEMALVTDISGVCSAWETFHTT